MKRNVLLLFLLVSVVAQAQNSINNYKYVVVPEKFDFLKDANQYGLNFLTKALLENKGFTVYFDNQELPKEIATDRCSALKAEVGQRKAIFSTNLTFTLKDCQGNVIFKSKEGKSREKDWATSYNEALTDAFKSLADVPYTYAGPAATTSPRPVEAPATTQPVTQPATPVTTPPVTPATPESKEAAGTLYAQATANGFQLIDTSPKIVMSLLKTSAADYYIATKGTTNGIVFKKNGEWVFEYYADNKLIAEKLLIKF
jgi:hypothetical protein